MCAATWMHVGDPGCRQGNLQWSLCSPQERTYRHWTENILFFFWIKLNMPVVSCNACNRKHERPINSKCLYVKAALLNCRRLGASTDDFAFYLPEIGGLAELQPTMSEPSPFPLMAEDIMALLQDNKECKKQLSDTRLELQRVMLRLDRLSLSQQGPQVITVPATTSTTLSSTTPPSVTSTPPVTVGASLGGASAWASINNQLPPQPNLTRPTTAGGLFNPPPGLWPPTSPWGTPITTSLPVYGMASSAPPPGLFASSSTSMGMPPPGHQQWMSYMMARPSLTTSTWSTMTPTSTGGYPTTAFPGHVPAPQSQWTTSPVASPASMGMAGAPGGVTSCNSALLPDPLGGSPVNVMIDASGIKSASKKRKCVVFDIEPHLHLDNVKSATIEDVISAEMSLLESLLSLDFPVQSLAKHVRFLTDKSRVYTSSSLVRYDLAMREKAEMMGPSAFVYGDHEFVHSFLGLENLKPRSKSGKDSQSSTKSNRASRPKGICWRFNENRGCKKEPCQWKHECRDCGGDHSLVFCKNK